MRPSALSSATIRRSRSSTRLTVVQTHGLADDLAGSGVQDCQLPRPLVEPLSCHLGTHDDVLDAGAVPAAQVDAWLDGERHSGLQDGRVAAHDVRVLVRLQPDAVAGAVHEELAVSRGADDVPRDAVDLLAGDAGANRRTGGLLGRAEHLV